MRAGSRNAEAVCLCDLLMLRPLRSSDARASGYAEAVVHVDNHTSKAHTVLQVCCGAAAASAASLTHTARQVRTRDRKGLFYDSMRATKDLKINVSYGKASDAARLLRCVRTHVAEWVR